MIINRKYVIPQVFLKICIHLDLITHAFNMIMHIILYIRFNVEFYRNSNQATNLEIGLQEIYLKPYQFSSNECSII